MSKHILAQSVNFFGSLSPAKLSGAGDATTGSIKDQWNWGNFSTAGITVAGALSDKTKGLIQVIKAPYGKSDLDVDLMQIQTQLGEGIRLRAGKQRLPVWMNSEHIQVKALYDWIDLPREVYTKMPITSYEGLSLEKDWGDMMLLVYAGGANQEYNLPSIQYAVTADELVGARLNYTADTWSFFVSALVTNGDIKVTQDRVISAPIKGKIDFSLQAQELQLFSTGVRMMGERWIFDSEYFYSEGKTDTWEEVSGFYCSPGIKLSENLSLRYTFSKDLTSDSYLTPSKTTTQSVLAVYAIDLNQRVKVSVDQIDYSSESATTTQIASVGNPSSSSNLSFQGLTKDRTFYMYALEWAFVF